MKECILCGKPIPIGRGRFFGNGYYAHDNCANEHDRKNNSRNEGYPQV